MIPKPLQAKFAANGYCKLQDFSGATGIAYANVLRRVQSGDIPAVDVSPSDSKRCQWRIYEEQAADWFRSRCSRPAVAETAENLPDFYSEDGEWIPLKERE